MANITANAAELLDTQIPAALPNNPDKAKEVNAFYVFKLTGDNGGTWTVDLVASPPQCVQGDKGNAQCTIEVANSDFMSMLTNPAAGMQLFMQGKLKVSGDTML